MTKAHSKTPRSRRLIKEARTRLSARYLAALRHHLDRSVSDNGDRAQGLGRAALLQGLVPHDLALMHHEAMVLLTLSRKITPMRGEALKRAKFFLAQAFLPLEAAQRETSKALTQLQQRNETLRLHTAALVRGGRRLEVEVDRRKEGEALIVQQREKYRVLFEESLVMQKKLRHVTRQVLSAQEEERKRISRELHDDVVQMLVGINVELSTLAHGHASRLSRLKDKIARTQRLVEKSVDAVHRFARELRPAVLDDLGLIPALHSYCTALSERKQIIIRLAAFRGVEALGGDERTVLYRVAQEALGNVARHAHATHVRLVLTKIPGAVQMDISDNGKSFPVRKVLSAKNPKRLGLIGMRERLEMIGGSLTIESAPGRGTTVRAEIPFHPRKAKS